MRKLFFTILPLLLFACINENTLHTNFPTHYLHSNSAKVWVVSKSSSQNDDAVAALDQYRKCFIFYSNGTFREQELIHLGSNQGLIGNYTFKKDKNGDLSLFLNYDHDNIEMYVIESISNHSLSLLKLTGNQSTWEFKTLNPPDL